MKIKVLGACCSSCNSSFDRMKEAAFEIDPNIEVVQVDNVLEILKYRVAQTPAIIIDEQIVSVGENISSARAKELILTNM